ncbi:MAG: M48 family metalloprotease [Nitrospiraceae bacterium]|nr:M48 family metalloprotease [Nitrospiraceae bacterium]
MAQAAELRTSSERTLFTVSATISLLAWLILIITIFGAIYGAMIGCFLFAAHALMIAHIRGNAVRVTQEQFPALHRRIVEAGRKLGLRETPAAYVMQAGGALNAFATKFVGRNFIVIYADLLEACDENGKEADMIIGHEIGHLALGHLQWWPVLLLSRILPWLGAAYSRACEYSCDLCGLEAAGGDLAAAGKGLAILAAGGKYGSQVNLPAFAQQASDTSGFWTSIYELNASHPFLPKRVAALMNHKNPGTVPVAGRHPLAYPLAPMFNLGAGAAPGVLVAVMIVGILAAIAIPQFAKYREKAKAVAARQTTSPEAGMPAPDAGIGGAVTLGTGTGEQQALPQPASEQAVPDQDAMDATLRDIHVAALKRQAQTGAWPCSMDELALDEIRATANAKQWQLAVDCNNRLAAVLFAGPDQKQRYRAIYFDDGQIAGGEM